MSVSLYRKYRPTRFEDIMGQEHVARTLVNAINSNRVSHAYLFAGPRGTGKTSTAKILAMALNCQAGNGQATAAPDGSCAVCEAIRQGSSMDVVEMDAASNRGIDDIRDLRDKVHFAPVEGRMKVYIVDEVHMLTAEAFNALLKTLEEPPVHAVFVLATTEPHKVPATILSRCQRFDFRRPSVGEVVKLLSGVATQESIETDEAALMVIARAAEGSFRDALGLLDQLTTYTAGKVGLQETLDILGGVQQDLLFEIVDLARDHDTRGALLLVERLSQSGTDYGQFIKDLLGHLRDLYVVRHTAEMPASLAATEEQMQRLQSQADVTPTEQVLALLDLLGEALRSIRQGSDPRLELEMALIKVTAAGADRTATAQEPPIRTDTGRPTRPSPKNTDELTPAAKQPPTPKPAQQAAGSEPTPQATPQTAPEKMTPEPVVEASRREPRPEEQPEAEPEAVPAVPEPGPDTSAKAPLDMDTLKRAWPVVLEAVKKRQKGLATILQEASPKSLEGDTLTIGFPAGYSFQAGQVACGQNPQVLAEVLKEITGSSLQVKTQLPTDTKQAPVEASGDARILSKDEVISVLTQEFNAQILDEDTHR